jgi:quercetin dioxygenase-like cupin family protein
MTSQTAGAVAVALLAVATTGQAQRMEKQMEVTTSGSRQTTKGPAEYFTGAVFVDPLFSATDHTRISGGHVTFAPGARSAWHTHPAGQVLIVTDGVGWVQEWNGEKREIKAGDVVWTPPGVKHWHGATSTTSMRHIAIQEMVDGKNVTWMEQVSDAQYGK